MHTCTGLLYRHAIKPLLFLFPADTVHAFFLRTGKFFGSVRFLRTFIRRLWAYSDTTLVQTLDGCTFQNPIGLSAGFDYNADLVDILPSVGFGFHTIGTLTYGAYEGNPPPMLGRLPKSRALLVNKGFKNNSIAKVLDALTPKKVPTPRGVSIGATNKAYATFDDMVSDIVSGFSHANTYSSFDYFELNVSCPNLNNIQNLSPQIASPEGCKKVLEALDSLELQRPVWIKLPLERTHEEFQALVDIVVPFSFVRGLVISNLAKDRTNAAFDACEVARAGKGNFSGKPVEARANDLIAFARKTYKDRFTIIGVGGVFSAEDGYKKIKAGADLVQLITGMVYRGPQLIGEINKGLVQLLKKDGYRTISDITKKSEVL